MPVTIYFPLVFTGIYIEDSLGTPVLEPRMHANEKFCEWVVQTLNQTYKDEQEAADRGG